MKNYKALLVDYDGTLASKLTGEIAPVIKETIRKLTKKGIIVSIVTGRQYFGRIRTECSELNLTYPQIVSGGAEIRIPKNDQILWARYIHDNTVKELIDYFQEKNVYFTAEKENDIFTLDGDNAFYASTFTFKKIENSPLKNIAKIIVPAKHNKLSLRDMNTLSNDLERRYKDLHIIKIQIADQYGLEITSEHATKHLAILQYLYLLHLQKEEVIGVGDGYNDYPLLTACGLKIAMGDAPAELKKIADRVVGTEREHGILTVINSFFI